MSHNRYARKADATTQRIVDELRAVGYVVCHIGRPVDISVRHPSWPLNVWMKLECKTPKGGKVRLRKDQQAQQAFCAEHGVPYVTNGEEAIRYLIENYGTPALWCSAPFATADAEREAVQVSRDG